MCAPEIQRVVLMSEPKNVLLHLAEFPYPQRSGRARNHSLRTAPHPKVVSPFEFLSTNKEGYSELPAVPLSNQPNRTRVVRL